MCGAIVLSVIWMALRNGGDIDSSSEYLQLLITVLVGSAFYLGLLYLYLRNWDRGGSPTGRRGGV